LKTYTGLEGFWNYAKERIVKFHGVSKEKFPLYLREMEFRYNHRNADIFDQIAPTASLIWCQNGTNYLKK